MGGCGREMGEEGREEEGKGDEGGGKLFRRRVPGFMEAPHVGFVEIAGYRAVDKHRAHNLTR